MPSTTNAPVFLCKLEDLEKTGAYNAIISHQGERFDLMVARDESGTVRAYHNVCPHIQTPLETFPHEFLDKKDPSIIICSTHGARFRLSDGECLSGPCVGQSLTTVAVTLRQDEIFMLPGQPAA
nr:Rieske 2Fe-2S domain-containing protein [uncultured Cohaesibacter sp.]